jgi:hypothetical protein
LMHTDEIVIHRMKRDRVRLPVGVILRSERAARASRRMEAHAESVSILRDEPFGRSSG